MKTINDVNALPKYCTLTLVEVISTLKVIYELCYFSLWLKHYYLQILYRLIGHNNIMLN